MIEYMVKTIPYAMVIVPIFFNNETVEEAYKRTLEYIYGYKIEKVIAKRDTKGNGIWEVV